MMPLTLKTVWRWSQLFIAIVMVVLEWLSRESVTFFIRPVVYFLKFLGYTQDHPKYTQEDLYMEQDTPEIITSRGYPVESHFVHTDDGFILGLHRIPVGGSHGKVNEDGASVRQEGKAKGVVLIVHGFMQSSEAFVTRRNSKDCLPFVLVDNGYDVWMGNNRGNKYSYKHISRKPNHEDFWDFSLDDMARFDLPAMIKCVLAESGASTLTLIGFSQGTAQSFACLSSNPEISKKVNLLITLAPVSTVRGFSNPVVDNLARARPDFIFLLFGKREMLPSTLVWRKFLSRKRFVQVIDIAVEFLFGWNTKCIDPLEKSLLYAHIYSYSSVKTVVQWFQIIQTGRFQMFDDTLGAVNNNNPYDKYSGNLVPTYEPSQIQCPVACFYGGNDNLPNTANLLDSLPPDRIALIHKEDEYEHLDFMWAKDVSKKIFPKILQLLNNYNNHNNLCSN